MGKRVLMKLKMAESKLYVIPMNELPISLQNFRNLILRSQLACTLVAGSSEELEIPVWEVSTEMGLENKVTGGFSSEEQFRQFLESELNPQDFTKLPEPDNYIYLRDNLTFKAVSEKMKKLSQRGISIKMRRILATPYKEEIRRVYNRPDCLEVRAIPAAAGRIGNCWVSYQPSECYNY